jgi:glycosyltransferase involved in cell wall biosynthesis
MKFVGIVQEHRAGLSVSEWGGFARHVNETVINQKLVPNQSELTSLLKAGERIKESAERDLSLLALARMRRNESHYRQLLSNALETFSESKPSLLYHHFNSFELPPVWLLSLARNFNIFMVTTLIDFMEIDFPNYFRPEIQERRRLNYEITINKARRFLVSSKFLRKDAVNYHSIAKSHIDVAPLGYDHIPNELELDVLKPRHLTDITRPYFVLPAKDWPNKGHKELIEVILTRKLDFRIVFTGNIGEVRKFIEASAKRYKYSEQIQVLGFLSDAELYSLMRHSSGLIFPSVYEGFGLPYVEAAQLEVPIICFKNKAVDEMFSDESIYTTSPGNFEDLLQLASSSLSDKALERRLKAAKRNTKDLLWKSTAERTLESYEKVIHG